MVARSKMTALLFRRSRFTLVAALLLLSLVAGACSRTEAVPHVMDDEDAIYGYVQDIDSAGQQLTLDISKWVNRDTREGADIAYEYKVSYDSETHFINEDGSAFEPGILKKGHKVYLDAPKPKPYNSGEGYAKQVILVPLSDEEKYGRLLARQPGALKTNVLYAQGTIPAYDEMDFDRVVPESFQGGINWIEMDPNGVIDYREEFDFEGDHIILLFDEEGVVFQTDDIHELAEWLSAMSEAGT